MSVLSVVHVAVPAPVGGLESVIRALSVSQRRRGLEVGVLLVEVPGVDTRDIVEFLQAGDVDVELVRLRARAYVSERRAVRSYLRRRRPSIVHTHGYRPDVIDAPVARRMGLPTVTTLHGYSPIKGADLGEWLQARALKRFDGVIAVSGVLLDMLPGLGVGEERAHLIPNGWVHEPVLSRAEAMTALGLSPGRKVIGWIGRMVPVKAADVFIASLAELEAADDWHALLIGDGPDRAACESLARELGVADRITFAGLVPGARRYVRALDVLALTSHSEGTPMILIEAMAEEVPIVATDVGGVSDLLGPGGGRLAPAADTAGLARAIRAVLDHPEEARTAASKARARVAETYDADTWAARHEQVYDRIVRERRAGSGGG